MRRTVLGGRGDPVGGGGPRRHQEGERSELSELHLELLNLQDWRWAGHGGGGEGRRDRVELRVLPGSRVLSQVGTETLNLRTREGWAVSSRTQKTAA